MSTKAGAAVPSKSICQPSKVLTCDNVEGLIFTDSDTIAFGKWKMKFNANISKA